MSSPQVKRSRRDSSSSSSDSSSSSMDSSSESEAGTVSLVPPSPVKGVILDHGNWNMLKGINSEKLHLLLNFSDMDFFAFLSTLKLLPTTTICSCGRIMSLVLDAGSPLGVRFKCECKRTKSATAGSFFARVKVPVKKLIKLAYLFSWEIASCDLVKHELTGADGRTLSDVTVSDHLNFLRDICLSEMNNAPRIGGPGTVVEIDESVFGKRKYNRGKRVAEMRWVFGGREQGGEHRKFVMFVEKRDKATLLAAIREKIEPGTEIHSDGWAAYADIDKMPEGYSHRVVNHSLHFKDPSTGVHTNGVEGMWQKLKSGHKRRFGTHRSTLESHMAEWWYFADVPKPDRFYKLLRSIAKIYPVD